MKKNFLTIISCLLIIQAINAQKYFTKNGHVSFFSKTNAEDIKATNDQVISVLNTTTGELQFSILIKSFHFEKALMEEHFNENYLESEKYPKSNFKGSITNISSVNFNKDGTYNVTVTGDLTLHGITQKITTNGEILISNGKPTATAKFIIKLTDYKINVPKLVKDKISESQEIAITCVYNQKM